MEQLNRAEYVDAVKAIKEAIQISRYRAAKLVNKEVLDRKSSTGSGRFKYSHYAV